VAVLVELRKRRAKESESAGLAYGAGLEDLDWYIAGDAILSHTLGRSAASRARKPGNQSGRRARP
jgi:hypothetical protein